MSSQPSPSVPEQDPQLYDIIIVGAGPAGLSTALHLAENAPHLLPRTLVLEKMRHPRHKLCGGGILPDGEIILRQLGLDLGEIPHVDVDWAHFNYDGQGFRMRVDRNSTYAFRTIRRYEFDAWLAAKALQRGVQLQEETEVLRLELEQDMVKLVTNRGIYHARAVVGADGSNSRVRRSVIPRENAHTARLLEVVTECAPEKSFHIQSDSYFDFIVLPQGIQGYTWDFPALQDGKAVRVRGIFDSNCLPHKGDLSLRVGLEQELKRHGLQPAQYNMEGFPIRWFEPGRRLAKPRLLLAGDAAGTDALYGEGISLALGYGAHAARALADAFERDDFSFHSYRSILLRTDLGKSLICRTWLARAFYRFHFAPAQALFWRHLGWIIRPMMRRLVVGWARRQDKRGNRRKAPGD